MTIVLLLVGWLSTAALALCLLFRRDLAAAWREPVLARPVLIIESDDWGYGPLIQVPWLDRIVEVLGAHRDRDSHPAIMTVGVVLAGPDTQRMRSANLSTYCRIELDNPILASVREALERGRRSGVLSMQLHGMEHYWPAMLMSAAGRCETARDWLTGALLPASESLPSAWQSRWTDAASLPSTPHSEMDQRQAVAEEVLAFEYIFGESARVVVPPTFVWNGGTEAAWAQAGVLTLVTPGRRYVARGADGKPVADDSDIRNGDRASGGLTCIVRDDYFEPAFGHTAARALAALDAKTRCGRPTLLETHRSNFIGEEALAERSLNELRELLRGALERHPDLRFMSTAELAQHYRDASDLVEVRLAPRLRAVLHRLGAIPRLRKAAWVTGLIVPAWLFLAACERRSSGNPKKNQRVSTK